MLIRLPRAPAAGSELHYIAFRFPIKPLDSNLPDRVEEPSGARGAAVLPAKDLASEKSPFLIH